MVHRAHRPRIHAALVLLPLALSGCPSPRAVTNAPSRTGPGSSEPASVPVGAPSFEVHEWGLLRGELGDRLTVGAVAPRFVTEPLEVDKPVLYVHAAQPFTLTRLDVDAHDGSIVEEWPPVPRTNLASQLAFRDVRVTVDGACATSPLPTTADAACRSLPSGDVCEVASLATVRTADAACMHVGDTTERFLFYRARTGAFTPPLRITRLPGQPGTVQITHVGTEAIPGTIVALRSDPYGVATAVLAAPPPGGSLFVRDGAVVATPTARGAAGPLSDGRRNPHQEQAGRDAMRATLASLGLTANEVDAFSRAWDDALFGLPVADVDGLAVDMPVEDDRRAVDVLTADESVAGRLRPTDSFLYFLPPGACEDVAALTIEPRPRAVRRALAVWVAPSH